MWYKWFILLYLYFPPLFSAHVGGFGSFLSQTRVQAEGTPHIASIEAHPGLALY